MTTTQSTRMNRVWFVKRVALPAILLVALGVWGLVDATLVYPKNGRLHASLKLKDYLVACDDARRLAPSLVKVDDPRAEMRQLGEREQTTMASQALVPTERTRLDWLKALKMVWALDAEQMWVADVKRPLLTKTGEPLYAGVGGVSDVKHEMVPLFYKPRTAEAFIVGSDGTRQAVALDVALKHMKDYWATAKTPSPLAFYDLPLQWVFVVVGLGGAGYLLVLFARVAGKRYQYEPETHTLILPGGVRVAAAEVKEFDKRRWHKFYVTMHMKDESSVTLDLYRHEPLEQWILEMEKFAFPDAVQDEGTKSEASGEEGGAADPVPTDLGRVAAMNYGGMMDGVFAVFVFDVPALEQAGVSPGAYAQGEVLKALGVALRDEGGWRQWLTAACGFAKGRETEVVLDWFAEREPTFKAVLVRPEQAFAEAMKAGGAMNSDVYVVVVGRLSEQAAAAAHNVLMDPPPSGFAAFATVRTTPSSIERFTQKVALEPGMEIKGATLVGRWEASDEDVETAGLARENEGVNAA